VDSYQLPDAKGYSRYVENMFQNLFWQVNFLDTQDLCFIINLPSFYPVLINQISNLFSFTVLLPLVLALEIGGVMASFSIGPSCSNKPKN
jgi:hypothetical protein